MSCVFVVVSFLQRAVDLPSIIRMKNGVALVEKNNMHVT